jgi:hypothetical protein
MRIVITAPGVGKQDVDNLTLVDPNGSDICRTDLEVPEYGKIYCWTKHETVADYQQVRLLVGEEYYSCESGDDTTCQYRQLTPGSSEADGAYPKLQNIELGSDTTITVTGINFYTAGYDVTATWLGFDASSVTVDSETQMTVTYDDGVPINSIAN